MVRRQSFKVQTILTLLYSYYYASRCCWNLENKEDALKWLQKGWEGDVVSEPRNRERTQQVRRFMKQLELPDEEENRRWASSFERFIGIYDDSDVFD
jgi:hypothetical protein